TLQPAKAKYPNFHKATQQEKSEGNAGPSSSTARKPQHSTHCTGTQWGRDLQEPALERSLHAHPACSGHKSSNWEPQQSPG
ncbi:hypothetical protein P7K49_017005, partial [Saguinus oedipus]